MNDFFILETLNEKHITQLHNLFKKMWWTNKRSLEEINKMITNSISFALIESQNDDLIGYARVITDEIKYAFIFDVMIDEAYRGEGLSKIIMHSIFSHPRLKNVLNFELTCEPNMVQYYEKFNFKTDFQNVVPMRYKR